MVRRRLAVLAVAVAAVVGVAACGSNEYRYVNNAEANTFFKVPSTWELFRVKAAEVTDRPTAGARTGPWRVVFDSAEQPDPDHVSADLPPGPVGQAVIYDIDAEQGDQLSPAALRTAFLGEDPVASTSEDLEMVSYEPLTTSAGLRGSRVVFNRRLADGTWVTTDHSSLINAPGTRVWVFEVRADASAFKGERNQINQIVDSFQVRS